MSVPKPLKRKIRHSFIWSIFFKRYDAKNKIVNLAGYEVHYCSHSAFLHLFHEIIIDQEYLFENENPTPLIIDCGSNIGMSVLYFKMIYPESEIIAFEPDLQAFECLQKNVEGNNFTKVTVNRKAITASGGDIDFYYDDQNPGSLMMSALQQRMSKAKQRVESVRLSSVIDTEVDFLKIDIEGAELEVLEELAESGKISLVQQMAIEYHHHIDLDKDELSKLLLLLENSGFGYQISSELYRPLISRQFQDFLFSPIASNNLEIFSHQDARPFI